MIKNTVSSNLRFETAEELFIAIPEVSDDMLSEASSQPSLDYLKELTSSSTPEEALTFSAYLLDKRRSVWWGRQCLNTIPNMLSQSDLQMLIYAENWVKQNNEESRNIALENATNVDPKTPGVWVALGAAWSGGSMVEQDLPPVPPPAFLTPRAINAGVLGILARVETTERKRTIIKFVRLAIDLIEG